MQEHLSLCLGHYDAISDELQIKDVHGYQPGVMNMKAFVTSISRGLQGAFFEYSAKEFAEGNVGGLSEGDFRQPQFLGNFVRGPLRQITAHLVKKVNQLE